MIVTLAISTDEILGRRHPLCPNVANCRQSDIVFRRMTLNLAYMGIESLRPHADKPYHNAVIGAFCTDRRSCLLAVNRRFDQRSRRNRSRNRSALLNKIPARHAGAYSLFCFFHNDCWLNFSLYEEG